MKTWLESERQGNGRRYWFKTKAAARAFARERRKRGHVVIPDAPTRSVWQGPKGPPRSKTRAYLAGIDPASGW